MEEDWLDAVFNLNSTLQSDVWVESVCAKTGSFIFNAIDLRARIFAKANVEVMHNSSNFTDTAVLSAVASTRN